MRLRRYRARLTRFVDRADQHRDVAVDGARVEEMAAVGQEPGVTITDSLIRWTRRRGGPASGRYAQDRTRGVKGKQDDAVAIPAAAAERRRYNSVLPLALAPNTMREPSGEIAGNGYGVAVQNSVPSGASSVVLTT